MQQRECPRGLGVLIIDHYKRSDIVSECETPKSLYVQTRVMAAEIANEQHIDSDLFRLLSQVSKAMGDNVAKLSPSVLRDIEVERFADRMQNGLDPVAHRHRRHEGQLNRLVLIFENGADHFLSRPHITDQSIDQGVLRARMFRRQCAEILPALSEPRGF